MFVACEGIVAVALLAAALWRPAPAAAGLRVSSAAGGLSGVWVASGTFGRIVLRLRGAGHLYRGTYTQGGKVARSSRVVARVDDADGAQQVILSFTPGSRSAFCALRPPLLFCQVGAAGSAVFARS